MKNLKKKGFTIVELVIVIAVIAVLAAVLIPTFVNLTKKANLSADQQAVAQMNKILAIEGADKDLRIGDVYEALENNGFGDYTTYLEEALIYWIEEDNVVVLVENGAVVFPEKYKGTTKVMTLLIGKGLVPETHFNKAEDGKGTADKPYVVNDPADMLYIGKMVQSGNTLANTYFKLDSNIALKDWAAVGEQSYGENGHVIATTPFSGTFDGNGKTITLTNAKDGKASALFSTVKNATIKNLTLDVNINSDNVAGGLVALVDLRYGANTTIENVTVKGTIKTSSNIAGGIIGNTNATYGESKAYNDALGILTLKNLTNNAIVESTYSNPNNYDVDVKVGGIVGQTSQMHIVMENCKNTGDLKAVEYETATGYKSYVSGLIGMAQGGQHRTITVTNCENTGTLTGKVTAQVIASIGNGGHVTIKGYTGNAAEVLGQLNRASSYSIYEVIINDNAYLVRAGGRVDDDSNKAYNNVLFKDLYNAGATDISAPINTYIDFIKYQQAKELWLTEHVKNIGAFGKVFDEVKKADATDSTLFGSGWGTALKEYNSNLSEADFAADGWTSNKLYKVSLENSGVEKEK